MRMCPDAAAATGELNIVEVTLSAAAASRDVTPRAFYMTSSCGMCGKASIEAVRTKSAYDVAGDPLRVSPELLLGLPAIQRSAQRQFSRTGGLHAAALFDSAGGLLCLREDVGRHNAFDKVDRMGGDAGTASAALAHHPRVRARQLRADAEGVDGRDPLAGGRFGAVEPGRGARG